MKNKIGFIGYGNQAKRLEKYLNKIGYGISFIYKPNILKQSEKFTNNFTKIESCNIVFICSTNTSHFKYLRKLIGKKYIFCEKHPVSSYSQLLKLRKIINNKVFFNYNLRFSEISKFFQKAKKINFGNLLYGNIILTHGLSSKIDYNNNWRSKKKLSPKGVFETVSIHAIDMISSNFNIKKILLQNISNTSGIGTSFDTSFTNIITNNNANIAIFSSYNAPLVNSWKFVFENGILNYDSNYLTLSGPKNNFDNNKNFIEPNIIYSKRISYNKIYEQSIYNSINFFMNSVKNKNKFENELSLKSNLLILKK